MSMKLCNATAGPQMLPHAQKDRKGPIQLQWIGGAAMDQDNLMQPSMSVLAVHEGGSPAGAAAPV